ncbi:MAG TPA: DNA-binding response regulator [Dysgonomonas sp.]|nr:DNA-binding response regulator [Dysgonomonas sp.]
MNKIISRQTDSYKLKCLVVDDESLVIKGIVNYIDKLDFLELDTTCSSAIEAISILNNKDIDLMFLDINMPYLTGIEFLETLENPPLTILITAYSEFALDGFRLHVTDYLLKPFSFQRFLQASQKALETYRSKTLLQNNEDEKNNTMYIRQGDTFQRIQWEDILYVEAMQNYLKLHMKDKMYIIHQTMASLEEILPKESFFRIHKSYLVNNSYIETISGNRLLIRGNELPISKYRREEFFNQVVYNKLITK